MGKVWFLLKLVTICLVFSPGRLGAQPEAEPVQAEWMIGDTPEGGWTVGDRIPLSIRVTHLANLEVTLPELPEAWGPFEVLEQRLLEPVDNVDGTLTAVRETTVTLWAPGDYQTPPLAVRYRDAEGELHEISIPPLSITVASVLSQDDAQKRDLKPQVSLPRPPVWPWILGGLFLAALVGVVGWILLSQLLRRTASTPIPFPTFDPRPPHETAFDELNRIAAMNLPTRGKFKPHYTLIAACMRAYVQGRYGIPALEQTTEELVTAFRQARVDRDHASLFRGLLAEADLVKFARFRPPVQQAYTAIDQARYIVDVTRPAEEPANQQFDAPNKLSTQNASHSAPLRGSRTGKT